MSFSVSTRAGAVRPFLAMEVMERGLELSRGGADIVHLEFGEPDFQPPPKALSYATEALNRGDIRYGDSRGLFELRHRIAEAYQARQGLRVDPDQIIITSGSSPAILLVMKLLINPGDQVILATPHYPAYPNMISVCGGEPVFVDTHPADGYRLDPDRVRAAITPKTKAIFIASPANPTGAVQPQEVVQAIAELGLPVLSDEIYDGLIFDDARVQSPLAYTEDCFVFDGFSKRFAMTGFRLGYLIAPRRAMRALQNMQQNLFISVSGFVQRAGLGALDTDPAYLEQNRATYWARRDIMIRGLRELGFGVPHFPPGAFFALADARHIDTDSTRLAFRFLEDALVAVGPGRDFGTIAEGFLRFSYSSSEERIQEGLRRLKTAL